MNCLLTNTVSCWASAGAQTQPEFPRALACLLDLRCSRHWQGGGQPVCLVTGSMTEAVSSRRLGSGLGADMC